MVLALRRPQHAGPDERVGLPLFGHREHGGGQHGQPPRGQGTGGAQPGDGGPGHGEYQRGDRGCDEQPGRGVQAPPGALQPRLGNTRGASARAARPIGTLTRKTDRSPPSGSDAAADLGIAHAGV